MLSPVALPLSIAVMLAGTSPWAMQLLDPSAVKKLVTANYLMFGLLTENFSVRDSSAGQLAATRLLRGQLGWGSRLWLILCFYGVHLLSWSSAGQHQHPQQTQ